ncbi:MAG: ribosome-associated translation inhibitor RaiA [Flavobacteriaceae bacterium]|nr:ribosome-associated translation inhibitor RaiA [Flavobacteriaceae bacterium]
MKVNIQSVNFNVDGKLVDFIEKRVEKLDNYYDKIIDANVYLKVQNTSEKENKIVEFKLNVPGDALVVKKQCRSFEEAVDNSADALERLLIKKKEKIRAHG